MLASICRIRLVNQGDANPASLLHVSVGGCRAEMKMSGIESKAGSENINMLIQAILDDLPVKTNIKVTFSTVHSGKEGFQYAGTGVSERGTRRPGQSLRGPRSLLDNISSTRHPSLEIGGRTRRRTQSHRTVIAFPSRGSATALQYNTVHEDRSCNTCTQSAITYSNLRFCRCFSTHDPYSKAL